jgi:triphosphoribosyl-dephospho-CoA synthase
MAFLAGFGDSHVARRHGVETANAVRQEAARIRAALFPSSDEAARMGLLLDFDRDLKARAVNPGTSADLTVACLLVHLLRRHLA